MTLAALVRERGPLTVAAFMDLALYDPQLGYYARAARRTGRAGDFFTSVDVGPLFGELLEVQLAEMGTLLAWPGCERGTTHGQATGEIAENARIHGVPENPASSARSAVDARRFDLVEAGAANGRLAADILSAAKRRHPAFYERIGLHLVETSAAARAAQPATLGDCADRLVHSSAELPGAFEGVLIANELLDALPTHQLVMREGGLREVYVAVSPERAASREARADGRAVSAGLEDESRDSDRDALHLIEGPPSTPDLEAYLDRLGITLEPGWRVEINLRAVEWVRDAARRLTRGFIILVDYGHEARELYSPTHSAGTLTSFASHRSGGPETSGTAPWLERPGEQDITAHVDFTSVRAAAEAEGMTTIALLDQTYFLLGLVEHLERKSRSLDYPSADLNQSSGAPDEPSARGNRPAHLNQQSSVGDKRASPLNQPSAISHQQLKTLVLPGGLGSTMKVLILGKAVGSPPLAGCSFKVRVT